MKKAFVALFFSLFLGLALEKVFSLNIVLPSGRHGDLKSEKKLLLSEPDGRLSESDARKVIRGLDHPVAKRHTVQSHEWLEKIAKEYGVSAISIRSTNDLEDPNLRPGQEITVQNKPGIVHWTKKDEPIESVLKTYERLGGKKANILAANNLDEVTYWKGAELFLLPEAQFWVPKTWRSYPYLSFPVASRRVSSRFGFRTHPILKVKKFHSGFDMPAAYGAPVYAGQSGVVVYAGWMGNYGNVVDIQHTKITTRYGHLSKIHVESGQKVARKQLIGRVGSTGLSTGPHLHFEVRQNSNGAVVRPGKYLY